MLAEVLTPTNDTQKGRAKAFFRDEIDYWVHPRMKMKENDRPTENV